MTPRLSERLQNLLRRSSSSNIQWIREIDGLRFIAIMAVILQHLLERFARHTSLPASQPVLDDPIAFFISRGTVGVFLFFAISGFVLALPFARYYFQGGKRVGIKAYFMRRLTRLEPPYLIWMGLFAMVLLIKGAYSWPDLFPHLIASLSYTHGIFFGGYSPINPVAWSLEVEIQFYLLAPLLAALFFSIKHPMHRRLILGGVVFCWILMQNYFGWWSFPYKLSLLGQLPHFLIGFLVADLYLSNLEKEQRFHLGWDLVALLAYVTMCYTWTTELWKNLVFAVALFALLIAAFRGVYFRKILQNGWIAVAGGMCYTIYLIHLPLLEGITSLTRNLLITDSFWANFLFQAAICLPLIWGLGALFFLILEKPFMKVSAIKLKPVWSGVRLQMNRLFIPGAFWAMCLLFTSALKAQIPFVQNTEIQPNTLKPEIDTLRLRPLEALIQSALQNAPELDANQIDYAKQTLVADVQRKSWTDMFTLNGALYYGNGTVNELRSVSGSDLEYATGRLGKGINLSLGVKLSGGDLTTRRQKTRIQMLQLDRLQSEREILEEEIRALITTQYYPLENILQVVRLRAEAQETIGMARSVAEKYFKEGNLPVGEYTTLLMQETKAREEFLKAQSEAKQRAVLLENICNTPIWAN